MTSERCKCTMRPENDPTTWDGRDCPLHYEEPEVHVVECRGGCARVFDKPHPDPLFVCRQCRLRMGQDV